jgi:ABC-type phosphonate transport system ATPase subunit
MTHIRKLGKAAILICSRHFQTLARNQARVNGVPDLSLVLIDHPLGGIDEASVRARLEQAMPQVLALLRNVPAP